MDKWMTPLSSALRKLSQKIYVLPGSPIECVIILMGNNQTIYADFSKLYLMLMQSNQSSILTDKHSDSNMCQKYHYGMYEPKETTLT